MPTPLTPVALNILFQAMTIKALGLPDSSFNLVRVDWQTEGQPFQKIDEDICYLRSVEEDDDYNRVRDEEAVTLDSDSVQVITSYTRVWAAYWTFYGPNSNDRARVIRSMLFKAESHDTLAEQNLYLVTDPSAPVRAPELFQERWWERVDFSARFDEAVQEVETVGAIKSAEILVQDLNGPVADLTVER